MGMEKYKFQLWGETPKYVQIANRIKSLIKEEKINQDEKLPAIRRLATFLGVNKDTIVKAYDKLVLDGAAYQKMGSGTYAKKRDGGLKFKKEYSEVIKKISKDNFEGYIDFSGENINITHFPIETFKDIINRVIERDGVEVFTEQESLGYRGLRENIMELGEGNDHKLENIIIVSGAQQGIDIIAKTIVNVNDNIVVERPTYAGAYAVFKFRRANIFEVPMERDGMNLIELEKILKRNKIKALYTMSYFQNPTGITTSYEKKKKLLELAKEYDFYIIEDDYLSEMTYDSEIQYRTLKSMDLGNRVIYVKSFSKLFLPGIRLGYIIGTRSIMGNIIKSKVNTDIATSSLMQRALDLYIREGYWKKQLKSMRSEYGMKYGELKKHIIQELGEYVNIVDPKGGMSIFLELKDKSIDDKEVFYNCLRRNVIITPGRIFYKRFKDQEKSIRLSFGKLGFEEMVEGIRILKEEIINSSKL